MKKIILCLLCTITISLASHSQQIETFDSNSWNWTEISQPKGKVYIVDGVMRLESKMDKEILITEFVANFSTHCYLPLDPQKGFHIKCNALVDKISDGKQFGIILDYTDDMNCVLFMIEDDIAQIFRIREGRIVGKQKAQFRIQEGKKKAKLDIEMTYKSDELEVRVNDVQAILCKNIPIKSNGFGFFAYGKCKVDFDNVEIVTD